jgi:nucleotide-binding universal stress UspA family protein
MRAHKVRKRGAAMTGSAATTHRILVGVTGAGENTPALRWAARDAAATGRGVTLVHVVRQVMPPPPPSVLLTSEPLLEAGRQVLRRVVAEYRDLTDEDCESVAEVGHPGRVLSELSQDADFVVLAHRRLSPLRRVLTWSTTVSAAAHAHCPVVSVPSTWSAEAGEDEAAREWVTVGIHENGTPVPVLEAAFEAAAARGLRLRALHAFRMPTQYDEIMRRSAPWWELWAQEQLRTEVQPVADKYPDVEVDLVVSHEWPADALSRRATTSQLVVVGRHGQHPSLPQRIGSVARTALTITGCPVMVVPV